MPVFSNVVSDLSPTFWKKVDFLDTLRKICKECDVNIIVADNNLYKLQGLWLGMVKAHGLLDQIFQQQISNEQFGQIKESDKTNIGENKRRVSAEKSLRGVKPPIKLKLKKLGKKSDAANEKEQNVATVTDYDADTDNDDVTSIQQEVNGLPKKKTTQRNNLRPRGVKRTCKNPEQPVDESSKINDAASELVLRSERRWLASEASHLRSDHRTTSECIEQTSQVPSVNKKVVANRRKRNENSIPKQYSGRKNGSKKVNAIENKNEVKITSNMVIEEIGDQDPKQNLSDTTNETSTEASHAKLLLSEAPDAKLRKKKIDSKNQSRIIHPKKTALPNHKDFISKRSLPRTRSGFIKPTVFKVLKRRGRPRKYPENAFEFPCDDCDFVGKTRKRLAIHREKVHLAKPVKCEYCEKIFPNEKYLKRHTSSHQGPQHCCEVCGKKFKIFKALNDHRRRHEDGYVRPQHPCEKCGKTFCNPYILECHIKAEHEGLKKSYLCATCGKSLTTKHALLRHVNAHMGIKPFPCEVCGKRFSYESGLKDHKNIHSNIKKFSCPNCRKSFSQRAVLKMHMRIHKDTKDFKCPDCGRGFTQKQALQRHQRVHKGEKPFTCKLCERSFIDASIIRKHLILFHKIHKDAKTWREDIICSVKKNTAFYIDRVNSESEKENGNDDQHSKPVDPPILKEDSLIPNKLYQNIYSGEGDHSNTPNSNEEQYVSATPPVSHDELNNEKPSSVYHIQPYKTFTEPVTCTVTTSPEPVHVYSPDESMRQATVFPELNTNQTSETRIENMDEYGCRGSGTVYYEQKSVPINIEAVDPHRTMQNVHTASGHTTPTEQMNRNQPPPDNNEMYSYSSLLTHYSQLANYYISALTGPNMPEMNQNSHTQYPVHPPSHVPPQSHNTPPAHHQHQHAHPGPQQ